MNEQTEADEALTRRLATGDRTALADAFDRFAPTLTRCAWAQSDSRHDVEEVVQDTFLTLWQRAAGIHLATSALLPWLLAVCREHVLMEPGSADGHASGTAECPGDEVPEGVAAHPDADEARGRLRWIRDDIAALAPTDRRLCELIVLEGHSYAEAAQILGLSVGAGAQRVSRSRARLQKAVMRDEH
ncbi:RNA polymerase sigma-70 factor (ECF subfamily) [Curtobacterium flaccumfaciens]|uniref:RNA polymerase sigma-70 factor (ECF subfamily) n=1 Tax=Curtobacterium flaccumfaciens TaxID=2035 RepID=A0A4R6DC11_9MICO|nr:sigma-70 family RNA polymerase sigma factor [Curtobacterium flaccumfaciens]TDN41860.1 RNA polymerase sigma-70 factor (ECF subfamily) [Curtobacterium flaccumfaciens]